MAVIVLLAVVVDSQHETGVSVHVETNMSIRQIANKLAVTPKALTREFELPMNASNITPLFLHGVTNEDLQRVVRHLLSHRDATIKYYLYFVLVLWGLIFLVVLGRPTNGGKKERKNSYPRSPYIVTLLVSVITAGFLLGKSPNPMEGFVKVIKSIVGLDPDPYMKVIFLAFFLMLAIVGNKLICGWACPFGALQELIYTLPILKKIKRKKPPFVLTNYIRISLFVIMLLFLFGFIGGSIGTMLYHYVNPFNLFNWEFETISIILTIIVVLISSVIVYRPFCQFICPFGLLSWITEKFSIFRVVIDKDKCNFGGACIKACPSEAAKGLLYGDKLPPDCFSCARCLNICPEDAIRYKLYDFHRVKPN